jgi:hypothetical protein
LRWKTLLALAFGSLLAACATSYQPEGLTGGYHEEELEPGIWRVHYAGNGYTNYETVQTYFLYRCAELSLEKGYDGFEILSNIRLVEPRPVGRRPVRLAANGSTTIFVPSYSGGGFKPGLEADIRLLKQPFTPAPPKIFNAAALKNVLEPLVQGPKCRSGNVCPHVHHYLYPPDTNDKPAG